METEEIQNTEVKCWRAGPFLVMECPNKEVYDYMLEKLFEQIPQEHHGQIIRYEQKLRISVFKTLAPTNLLRSFGEMLVRGKHVKS